MLAHMGPAQALPVPVMVVVVTLFAIWFSQMAAKKRWIGR